MTKITEKEAGMAIFKKRETLKFYFGCAASRMGRLYSPSGISNRFKATCH